MQRNTKLTRIYKIYQALLMTEVLIHLPGRLA